MNHYEAIFIFRPDIEEEKLDKEMKSIKRSIKTHGKGDVQFTNLGKKTLAYSISKCDEGVYVNYEFTAQPTSIAKIKKSFKHRESILRILILVKGRS
jgi:small subunit ribosomal protein S6